MRFVVALVILWWFLPCASAQGFVRPIPVTDWNIRHALTGASVLPPAEAGWFLIGKGPDGIAFARFGVRVDNTLSASVMTSLMNSAVESMDQMLQHAQPTPENTNPNRFRILRYSAEPDPTRKEMCLLRRWQTEDRGAVRRSAAEFLVQSSVDLVCRHPGNPRLIYTVHLSERDQPGGEAAKLESLAAAYRSGFQFEPLPADLPLK